MLNKKVKVHVHIINPYVLCNKSSKKQEIRSVCKLRLSLK